DLTALDDAGWETAGQSRARVEAHQPFDVKRGPLLRVTLLRHTPEEHVVLVTLHHIIADGWSIGVLLDDGAALYPAFAAGPPSPLPELPVQYADFAVWQPHELQGAVVDAQLAYWRRQLADAPAALELPTDRPRPPTQSFRGAVEVFELAHELSEA